MRIKHIVPSDEAGVANRAAQLPREILRPDTDVECIRVRNGASTVGAGEAVASG